MKKILWIDDEPGRFSKLANLPDVLVFFAHGREQIEHYLFKCRYRFDLIILDHDMPLMNGTDVCTEFLWQKNIPVVLCSNNSIGRDRQKYILTELDTEEYKYPIHDIDISRADFTERVLDLLDL